MSFVPCSPCQIPQQRDLIYFQPAGPTVYAQRTCVRILVLLRYGPSLIGRLRLCKKLHLHVQCASVRSRLVVRLGLH